MRRLTKRIKVVPGGTSAGKTYGIIPILIDTATKNPKCEISIVSETVPHLRKGALKDFLKIMAATGRFNKKNYNKTLLTYTFANGSYIEFFSADQEEKVRGPRRNILYINECNNINFETYHQLAIRTDREIWLDFNPSAEFWAYQELVNDEDAEWCTLTYKDNEALSSTIVTEIEKAKTKAYYNPDGNIYEEKNIKSTFWDNWWKVYGLGLLGTLQGAVLTNWVMCEAIPDDAAFVAYGLDFGFTNDETGLVEVYKQNGELWINELIYSTGMTNSDISVTMTGLRCSKNKIIVADCAEPKSIEELKRLGWYIEASMKGPDSIKNGLDILQRYKINVTKASTNLIKELRQYCWEKKRDESGKLKNIPVDAWNHLIDPMRYVALNKLKTQGNTVAKSRLPYRAKPSFNQDFDFVK